MINKYPAEWNSYGPKIYYLSFDGIPFYVGCTKMKLIKRLTDSRNDAKSDKSKKNVFILKEMTINNKTLQISLLETVDDERYAGFLEEYWVWQLKAWGFSMYNKNLLGSPKKIDKRGRKRYENIGESNVTPKKRGRPKKHLNYNELMFLHPDNPQLFE